MTMTGVVGHLTIDDVYFSTREVHKGLPGGSAIYAAIGARIWTTEVGVVARLGYDFPAETLKQFEQYGIRFFLHPINFPTMKGWMRYDRQGRRTNAAYPDSGTAEDLAIRPEEIPEDGITASAFHIASMPTLCQIPLAKQLNSQSKLITLDPHPDLEKNLSVLYEVFSYLVAFLPSMEQVELAFRHDDAQRAIAEFAAWGAKIVVIKMAEKGSILYDVAEKYLVHIPIYRTHTIDPTGAGDAYCGGFLASYLAEHDPVLASCCGTVSASYVVENFGALAPLQKGFIEATKRLNDVRKRVSRYSVNHKYASRGV